MDDAHLMVETCYSAEQWVQERAKGFAHRAGLLESPDYPALLYK
jgi:hypothetical protein